MEDLKVHIIMSAITKVVEEVAEGLKPKRQRRNFKNKNKQPKENVKTTPTTDGSPPNKSRSITSRAQKAPKYGVVNFKIETALGKLAITACFTERSIAWVHYSLDPHGYKESGLYKGDAIPSIPDGLMLKGVSAEVRQIDRISAPGTNDSSVTLNGQMWSCIMIKLAGFRTNTVLLANVNNEDVSVPVIEAFKSAIRNFSYPPGFLGGQWIPLPIDGWFWRAQFLVPQARLPEPVDGVSRTVDKFRLIVKASTVLFNAPSLLNQGIDVGGSFQRAGESRTHLIPEFDNRLPVIITVGFQMNNNPPTGGTMNVQSPLLIPNIIGFFNWGAVAAGTTIVAASIGTLLNAISVNGTIVAPVGNRIYWQVVTTGGAGGTARLELATDTGPATPVTIVFASANLVYTAALTNIVVPIEIVVSDADADSEIVSNTTYDIPLPPLSMNEIAVNDPNYLIGLPRRDDGIYLVQQKFSNLRDWQFAEASSFAGINFTSAEGINHEDAYVNGGIRDVADKNLNIAVLLFQGISQTAQIVDETTVAWEGQAATDSTIGLFQHEGSETCLAALEFYNNFCAQTKGIYPARANFLGNICKMITGFLRNTLLSSATPDFMARAGSEVGKAAHEQLMKYLQSKGV